ncbi:MAG: helix-turn-helix domain-containing protein [Rhizobiales bacterium]|nr:helix-turn-helix domain-containing protein [Hyphomicrobiales bacterium]
MSDHGWHPQEIIAAVRKKGSSLQRLGLEHGFSRITFNRAAKERFPRAHQLIAEFLGVPRQVIWPQFYHANGEPKTFKQVRAEAVQQARAA